MFIFISQCLRLSARGGPGARRIASGEIAPRYIASDAARADASHRDRARLGAARALSASLLAPARRAASRSPRPLEAFLRAALLERLVRGNP